MRRVGIERAFLPADAAELMTRELPGVTFLEAHFPFERLRARKTREELESAARPPPTSWSISMLAVIASHGPGATKLELVEALRREEVNRGLTFEYCLLTAGTNLNRAPSDKVWGEGDILSLDSGGNYKGYIGDLCRMAIQGEPDAELVDLLGEVDAIQMAARKPIRSGANGGDIYVSAGEVLNRSPRSNSIEFVAHGMGLISHEAPRLTGHGPIKYPAYDADRPLESGMVISIETTLVHSRRGFIKLEDALAVTDDGYEAFGDRGRGWNAAACARASISEREERRTAQAIPGVRRDASQNRTRDCASLCALRRPSAAACAGRRPAAADRRIAERPRSARPRLSMTTVEPKALPLTAAKMERHVHSSQAFVPMDCASYLVMVAPKGADGKPDPSRLRFAARTRRPLRHPHLHRRNRRRRGMGRPAGAGRGRPVTGGFRSA